jgi:hypothetical protein
MIDALILDKCRAAAQLFNIPDTHLLVFARIESNFNPTAHNTSSGAAGLFQYVRSTAAEENIDPLNLEESCGATAKRIARDLRWLSDNFMVVSLVNLYLIHQQGRRGFGEILDAAAGTGVLKQARLRNMIGNVPASVANKIAVQDLTSEHKEQALLFIEWWDDRLESALEEVERHLKH